MMKKLLFGMMALAVFFLIPSSVSATKLSVPSQYSTIQFAIDAAQNGDQILVAAGIYNEVIDYNDKALTITGEDKNTTIIDGTGYNSSVVTIIWRNPIWLPDDWLWPTTRSPEQTLENFTIQGGNALNFGGGIHVLLASPTLRNLVVKNNTVHNNPSWGGPLMGGGIAVRGSGYTVIENCEIQGNGGANRGGGILSDSSNLTVSGCRLAQNNAVLGSAISSAGSTGSYRNVTVEDSDSMAVELVSGNGVLPGVSHAPVLFENCLIRNNLGDTIWVGWWVKAIFKNCEISGNTGWETGALYTRDSVQLIFDHVTMTNNTALASPGVATINTDDERQYSDGSITITNSILWGNIGDYQILPPGTSLHEDFIPVEQFISYSIIQGGYPQGDGILDADPLFVDSVNGDYHLMPNSSAIDSGDPNSPLDLDGSRTDMGAYQFFHEPTSTEVINNLIDQVESFNLQQGIENSLDAKLDTALNTLNDLNENNNQAAINSLQAFINAVEAQRENKITNEQADILVQEAQEVIVRLES